jgi:hypothetical protein
MTYFPRGAVLAAVFCTVALAGPVQAHEFKAGTLTIHHPWSPPTPANATVAAGYMAITNNGKEDDRLLAATAEISTTCQIHEMKMDKGVMVMNELKDGLVIPAGGEVLLKPGDYHVMMMGVTSHPGSKTLFTGTLTFAKAGKVEVKYFVQEAK